MNTADKIYVAGHRGMVGSAVCRALAKKGCANVVTRTHKELDLLDPAAVAAFARVTGGRAGVGAGSAVCTA